MRALILLALGAIFTVFMPAHAQENLTDSCFSTSSGYDRKQITCLARLASIHVDNVNIKWNDATGWCDAFSQAGKSACLTKLAAVSEEKIKQAEAQLSKTLTKLLKNRNPQHIHNIKPVLKRSARGFSSFRKAHCESTIAAAGVEIGTAIPRNACVIEMNSERIDWLHNETKVLREFTAKKDQDLAEPVQITESKISLTKPEICFNERNNDRITTCLARVAAFYTDNGTVKWDDLISSCYMFYPAGMDGSQSKLFAGCMNKLIAVSEKKLKLAEDRLFEVLPDMFPDDFMPEFSRTMRSISALTKANQEFVNYRNSHCLFFKRLGKFYNSTPVITPRSEKACTIEVNVKRAGWLRNQEKELLEWRKNIAE